MSAADPLVVLRSLPGPQQVAIREWMDEFELQENGLTLPMLRFLAGAAEVQDEGVKRVLAALIAQESVQLALQDRFAPGVMLH